MNHSKALVLLNTVLFGAISRGKSILALRGLRRTAGEQLVEQAPEGRSKTLQMVLSLEACRP